MNYKLFGVCFKQEHFDNLDKNFTPFNNMENKFPRMREYPLLLRAYEENKDNPDIDAWGLFGPKFLKKWRLPSDTLVNAIENNPDNDIWLFNHARIISSITLNVWEQTEYLNGMRTLAEYVFKKLEIPAEVLRTMTYSDITVYCHYVVAKKSFWNEYIPFLKKIKYELDILPPNLKEILNRNANYHDDSNLNYFPFIIERMLTTFLVLNKKQFKIYADPYNFECYKFDKFHTEIFQKTCEAKNMIKRFPPEYKMYPYDTWVSYIKTLEVMTEGSILNGIDG
jgi:hypothetical protein